MAWANCRGDEDMCREALGISVLVKLCTALISYRVGLSVVLADGDNGVFILQSPSVDKEWTNPIGCEQGGSDHGSATYSVTVGNASVFSSVKGGH
jgi:hypothetical protein